jgi:Flp pilus assembly protein TadD
MKNRLDPVLTRIASSLKNPLQVSAACGLLILAATLLAPARLTQAQPAGHPAESSRRQQIHEAVSLAEHGDPNSAMQIASQLLKQDPQFVPAMNLKGMSLEGTGRGAEAGAEYEEALKLAPNDGDLLLKTGIYNLATGRSVPRHAAHIGAGRSLLS